jgi:hypothetical protein
MKNENFAEHIFVKYPKKKTKKKWQPKWHLAGDEDFNIEHLW